MLWKYRIPPTSPLLATKTVAVSEHRVLKWRCSYVERHPPLRHCLNTCSRSTYAHRICRHRTSKALFCLRAGSVVPELSCLRGAIGRSGLGGGLSGVAASIFQPRFASGRADFKEVPFAIFCGANGLPCRSIEWIVVRIVR